MVTRSDDTWTRSSGNEIQVEKRECPSGSRRREDGGDSRRPSWSLGLRQLHLKYYNERALKRLLNPKPSIAILGSSHTIVHVIPGLTDA